jgi:hypothetical protein
MICSWCSIVYQRKKFINCMEHSIIEKLMYSYSVKKFLPFMESESYCVHKSPPPVHIVSQKYSVHTFPPYFPTNPSMATSSGWHLIINVFQQKKLYAFIISPMRAMCPTHLILLDVITLTKLGKSYNSWSTSLCRLFRPPTNSYLLKVKLSLCLTKHHAMKTYWGVEV